MSPTIYLAAILGFIIALFVMRLEDGKWDFYSWDDFLIQGTCIGFVVGFVIWLFVGVHNQPKCLEYEKDSRGLIALKDGQGGVSGNFFLGSGSFSGDMKYYGYEDLGNSRYKMVKFPIDNSIIIEDVKEGGKPMFVEIREKADMNDKAWKNAKWMIGPFELDEFVRWEIHVPKGSVMKDIYELDLE
jgi:hypothetical protein